MNYIENMQNVVASVAGLCPLRESTSLRVLMYHKIVASMNDALNIGGSVEVRSFEWQIQYLLENHFKIISADEVLRVIMSGQPFQGRSALITFDDGALDNYINAFPILKKYRIPALFFISTGLVGTNMGLWWDVVENSLRRAGKVGITISGIKYPLMDLGQKRAAFRALEKRIKRSEIQPEAAIKELQEQLGALENQNGKYVIDWKQIGEMADAGMFFGAHTVSHPFLSRLDDSSSFAEIKRSKDELEGHLKKKIEFFAYPYGARQDYGEREIGYLKELGFIAAFSTEKGFVEIDNDPYRLKRIPISGIDNHLTFRGKINNLIYSRAASLVKDILK